MEQKRSIWEWLTGGLSIGKFRLSFTKLRFWKCRYAGRKPDIDKDI